MTAEIVLGLVGAERALSLVFSARNSERLLRAGAVEMGAAQFPLVVALHAAWLIGLWRYGADQPIVWPFLALYGLVEVLRAWTLMTLGSRWTARVLVVPGERLVRRGPYRFLSHPNYAVIALEIPLLPLAFSMPVYAFAFGLANLAFLAWRIRVEERALFAFAASGS